VGGGREREGTMVEGERRQRERETRHSERRIVCTRPHSRSLPAAFAIAWSLPRHTSGNWIDEMHRQKRVLVGG
jgi:hypothetical protein